TNDDNLDVVVITQQSIFVFPGIGNGDFGDRLDHAGQFSGPWFVADWNGDDNLDLVQIGSSVEVLPGTGGGGFGNRMSGSLGLPEDVDLAARPADVNGDGLLDVVVITTNTLGATTRVLLRQGNNMFAPPRTVTTGRFADQMDLADLNGDGHLDLVLVGGFTRQGIQTVRQDNVVVFLGNDNGDFAPGGTFAAGQSPQAVAFGDINLDGRPDLVTANQLANSVTLLLGDGNGAFLGRQDFAVEFFPGAVALAELDGDGDLDFLTANRTSISP